jgi:hypothetical protein
MVKQGSSGDVVREIQTNLNLWGSQSTLAGNKALAVDGKFGPRTRAAVVAFQKEAGIQQDGIVGPETRRTLKERKAREAEAAMAETDLKALADSLIVVAGTASASDQAVVVAELLKMPQAALEVLRDEGAKVWVCQNSVTQVRTDLAGVRPRGWPPGSTWDTVPGLFDGGNNRVIIATRAGRVPPQGDGHGSHNLVIHEVGHAVDHNSAASESPAFVASRKADEKTLGGYESQAGAAGREETYAESMGRYHGGDAGDAAAHPNLHRYWEGDPVAAQIFAQIRQAARPGGDPGFVKRVMKERHLTRANAAEKAGMLVSLRRGRPFDTDFALRILKSGVPADILREIGNLGMLGQFVSGFAGQALAELLAIASDDVKALAARGQKE